MSEIKQTPTKEQDIQQTSIVYTLLRMGNITFYLLLAVWALIRIFEGLARTPILASEHIYLLGLAAGFLVLCTLTLFLLQTIRLARNPLVNKRIWPGWLSFLGILVMLIYFHESYRIVAITLSSLLYGFNETAGQGVHALVRLYPLHPFVPIFAGLEDGVNPIPALRLFERSLLNASECRGFLIVCNVVGLILLFLPKGFRPMNCICLLSALYVGLGFFQAHEIFVLPSGKEFNYIIYGLLFALIFNSYSTLRALSLPRQTSNGTGVRIAPSVVAIIFWVLIAYPVFADMHNQFSLAQNSMKTMQQVSDKPIIAAELHKNISSKVQAIRNLSLEIF